MTAVETRLCELLLREHFGELVSRAGTHLVHMGPQPLRLVALGTGLNLDQVKKALCVLLQHGMASFKTGKRGVSGPTWVEYTADCAAMLRMLRYTRYVYCAKTLYGDAGELLIEETLQHGQLTMSAAVRRVADRMASTADEGKTVEYSDVAAAFTNLVNTHFLQRCLSGKEEGESEGARPEAAPMLVSNEKDMYTVPKIPLIGHGKRRLSADSDDLDAHPAKKRKVEESLPDDGIYWRVNFERFHQHFHNQAIVSAVASKMDKTAGEIVRTMLRMSELTTPPNAAFTQLLASTEIFRSLPPEYGMTKPVLDQYLSLLADDPMEFVTKSGESGGGTFIVNLLKSLKTMARCTLESIVQERFGSRAARIFRLLLQKRHLEQKQVEDFAMIPAKEAKEMLYTMVSQNFVTLQEIPKAADYAPARTFYLYTVNVEQTARFILQRCYKTVTNLIARRHHETKENKRLLEKAQRIEAILASVQASGADEAQLQEIEEMITATERQQLENLKRTVNKLDKSEMQVDETVFLLETFLQASRPQ
ncbi:DNA-directed RNA polymerase III subunit RPC3 isoform X1 [Petromyzon marinus]|nr:DNA-directed RNA polymerase III subunit RPC3 isoform X2 [Petromyzon marinus]XP_032804577.1 DNA-directed RNA polymerase III subunit RPC3 isoform X2 [Petromyzon marinus]XP_032804585.1 DNA-directed RNA polymerase III subunit RPC3 isoform X2 [Petromyzon marinus]